MLTERLAPLRVSVLAIATLNGACLPGIALPTDSRCPCEAPAGEVSNAFCCAALDQCLPLGSKCPDAADSGDENSDAQADDDTADPEADASSGSSESTPSDEASVEEEASSGAVDDEGETPSSEATTTGDETQSASDTDEGSDDTASDDDSEVMVIVNSDHALFQFDIRGEEHDWVVLPPYEDDPGRLTIIHDLVATDTEIHLFYGSYTPIIATYSLASKEWTQRGFANWNTVPASGSGALALTEHAIWATDSDALQDPHSGLIRFSLDGEATRRVFDGTVYHDLCTEPNRGLLALRIGGSVVDQIDVDTETVTDSIVLDETVDAISAFGEDSIFGSFSRGRLLKFSGTGRILGELVTGNSFYFGDLDIDESGRLYASGHGAMVVVVDTEAWKLTHQFDAYQDTENLTPGRLR